MKKASRIPALLAAIAVMGAAAGCQGGGASSEPKKDVSVAAGTEAVIPSGKYNFGGAKVVVASPYEVDLTPGFSAKNDRLRSHIEAMKKNWNVEVEFKLVDADTYWGTMSTAILGGSPLGDICVGSPVYLQDWIGAGAVRDVSGTAAKLGIDFQDGGWNAMTYMEHTYGKATYGFARGASEMTFGVLYNKKRLSAAGLQDPNELISSGKEWNLDTFAQYARAMTKIGADGDTEVWGAAETANEVFLWGCIAANGGKLVDYAATPPTLTIDSAEALKGMELHNRMLNVDKSITRIGYQSASEMLPSGEIGMLVCEEWVAGYVRDYAAEHDMLSEYGLTYFPKTAAIADYIDPSAGTLAYFIPSSLSDEEAERALACYAALYALDDGVTVEENCRTRGEELFSDEASVNVYVDITKNGKQQSYCASRVGLYYSFQDMTTMFWDNAGTPKSITAQLLPEMKGFIADSSYVKIVKAQG